MQSPKSPIYYPSGRAPDPVRQNSSTLPMIALHRSPKATTAMKMSFSSTSPSQKLMAQSQSMRMFTRMTSAGSLRVKEPTDFTLVCNGGDKEKRALID